MGSMLSGSMVWLMETSSKRAYATCCVTQVCCTQSPCPCSGLLLTPASTGNSQTLKGRLVQSPWGLLDLVHRRRHTLRVSLVHVGFDSKCDFVPPTVLPGLHLCPWIWGGVSFWWDQTFSCLWLFSSEL